MRTGRAANGPGVAEKRLHGKRHARQRDLNCHAWATHQEERDDQQEQPQQHPVTELCPQGNRRHDVQRHRDTVSTRDRGTLYREPGETGDQASQPADKYEAPHRPAHLRRAAANRQRDRHEQQRAEQ